MPSKVKRYARWVLFPGCLLIIGLYKFGSDAYSFGRAEISSTSSLDPYPSAEAQMASPYFQSVGSFILCLIGLVILHFISERWVCTLCGSRLPNPPGHICPACQSPLD